MILAGKHVSHDGDEQSRDGLPAIEHARDRGTHRRGAAAVIAVLERGLDLCRGGERLCGDQEGAGALHGLRHFGRVVVLELWGSGLSLSLAQESSFVI